MTIILSKESLGCGVFTRHADGDQPATPAPAPAAAAAPARQHPSAVGARLASDQCSPPSDTADTNTHISGLHVFYSTVSRLRLPAAAPPQVVLWRFNLSEGGKETLQSGRKTAFEGTRSDSPSGHMPVSSFSSHKLSIIRYC